MTEGKTLPPNLAEVSSEGITMNARDYFKMYHPDFEDTRFYCSVCQQWLYGHSDTAPDHVCFDAALQGVENFCSSRLAIQSRLQKDYVTEYPLPIGFEALKRWVKRVRPRYHRFDALPQPLVTQRDALLGLVVHHTPVPSCHVWLLGLVKEEDTGFFRFMEPLLLIEGCPTTSKQIDDMVKKQKNLLSWYSKVILGKTIGGRPAGTGGHWVDVEDFRNESGQAVDKLLNKGMPLIKANVAPELQCDEKTLYTWCKKAGYANWQAFIADLQQKRSGP